MTMFCPPFQMLGLLRSTFVAEYAVVPPAIFWLRSTSPEGQNLVFACFSSAPCGCDGSVDCPVPLFLQGGIEFRCFGVGFHQFWRFYLPLLTQHHYRGFIWLNSVGILVSGSAKLPEFNLSGESFLNLLSFLLHSLEFYADGVQFKCPNWFHPSFRCQGDGLLFTGILLCVFPLVQCLDHVAVSASSPSDEWFSSFPTFSHQFEESIDVHEVHRFLDAPQLS